MSNGNHFEYIKQATRTGADTYIAPLIMENKEVTKIILKRSGINVPGGITARSLPEAAAHYPLFAGKGMVIKPKSTNFGKGITIFKDNPLIADYQNAVRQALEHDSSVLIEEFIPGPEYRFLVIGDEVANQYKTIAIQAARAVGAQICGADIIIQDILAEPTATNYSVIELNFNPSLYIHNFPCQGQNRHVERKVLDLLGF